MSILSITFILMDTVGTVVFAESNATQQKAQALIAEAPIDLGAFLKDPWGVISALLLDALFGSWKVLAAQNATLLGYLLFVGLISYCLPDLKNHSVLSFIEALGTFRLLADHALNLVTTLSLRVTEWKTYLIAFSPVYSAVIAAGGQPMQGALYSGAFLTVLQFLAAGIETCLVPLTRYCMVLAAAGVFSGIKEFSALCTASVSFAKKAVKIAGMVFASIMSVQKLFAAAAEHSVLQAGRNLISTIPIVGQALSSASATVFTAAAVLRTGVGFAGTAVLATEFIPLWLRFVIQILLLHGSRMVCQALGLKSSEQLLRSAVSILEAAHGILVVFFMMCIVATALVISS